MKPEGDGFIEKMSFEQDFEEEVEFKWRGENPIQFRIELCFPKKVII